MIRLPATLLAASVAATLIAAGAAAQERPSRERGDFDRRSQRTDERAPDAFTARYASLIVENNIFLRDRRPPRQAPVVQTTRPAPPPPQPEKDWMLVGIVFEQGAFRAYFENIRDNGVTRALPGDPIARGRVTDVFIDAVGFEIDGRTTWVEIGHDLTGSAVVLAQPAPRQLTPGSRPAATPGSEAAPPDPSGLSVEERLRLRRLQESGGATVTIQPKGVPPEIPPEKLPPDTDDPDNLQRVPPPDPDDPDSPQRVPPPDPDDPDAPQRIPPPDDSEASS